MLVTESQLKRIITRVLMEAAGVPTGITETANLLYNDIKKELVNTSDEMLGLSCNFVVKNNYEIGGYKFNEIRVFLFFEDSRDHKSIQNTQTGLSSEPEADIDNYKISHVDFSIDNSSLSFHFTVPSTRFLDRLHILRYLGRNKIEIIKNITHELKHRYDLIKKPDVKMHKQANYNSYSNNIESTKTQPKPINNFLYAMYYTNEIENLVKTSELYSLLTQKKIKKSGFKQFVENTNIYIYITLKSFRDLNFKEICDDLKANYINNMVSKIYQHNVYIDADNTTPDEILNKYLETLYSDILYSKTNTINGYMSNETPDVKDYKAKNDKYYKKHLSTASHNYMSFFTGRQNEINRNADKVLRKISALYNNLDESLDKKLLNNIFVITETTDKVPLNYYKNFI